MSLPSVLRIRDVYPGSAFFHPGSRVKKIPDPRKKILVVLKLKTVSNLSEKLIVMFIPDPWSGSWYFPHPLSRIRIPVPRVKKHRFTDPDSPHCYPFFPILLSFSLTSLSSSSRELVLDILCVLYQRDLFHALEKNPMVFLPLKLEPENLKTSAISGVFMAVFRICDIL